MSPVRGYKYKKTVGKIINYENLAVYLITLMRLPKKFYFFFDSPCGTGDLLAEIRNRCISIPLFGLDNSAVQLNIASQNVPDVIFYKSDIFSIANAASKIPLTNGFCHIGFSFFNTINSSRRQALLRKVYKCSRFSSLGFEIQNSDFQHDKFKCGKWYDATLEDGTTLRSRSTYLGRRKKHLELEFRSNEGTRKVTENLYEWPLNECLNQCVAEGWRECFVHQAKYRTSLNGLPSHWFIHCIK